MMKPVIIASFLLLLTSSAITSYAQTEDEIITQIRKIITAAESDFKNLKTGSPQKVDVSRQYSSSIRIAGTQKHWITISDDGKSSVYIIPINNTLNQEQTDQLYATWNQRIAFALGEGFEKNCIPIEMGDAADGEQCDYTSMKNPRLSVTLANIYSSETETASLDLYIRNEP